jgi:cytochrome oxidase Cu insertion factor (SCO1/SenC/PrrC family)
LVAGGLIQENINMRTCASFGCVAVMMLASANLATAADPEPLGVGQKAPSFNLTDQDGVERSLDDFLKKGNVAVVFYRSADW